jgi:hypothetical protein
MQFGVAGINEMPSRAAEHSQGRLCSSRNKGMMSYSIARWEQIAEFCFDVLPRLDRWMVMAAAFSLSFWKNITDQFISESNPRIQGWGAEINNSRLFLWTLEAMSANLKQLFFDLGPRRDTVADIH